MNKEHHYFGDTYASHLSSSNKNETGRGATPESRLSNYLNATKRTGQGSVLSFGARTTLTFKDRGNSKIGP